MFLKILVIRKIKYLLKKRRSKEEIQQEKLKKEQERIFKKQKREEENLKGEQAKMENLKKLALISFKLIPGKLPDALSAMKVIQLCKNQQIKVDNFFAEHLC